MFDLTSHMCFAAAFASACLSTHSASAQILFDFEDQSQTGFNNGALTSLTLQSGGLTATITRPGSPNQFDIYDLNDLDNDTVPSDWGARSISPWFSNDDTAFVVNFDRAVQSVSIDMGDVGGDNDSLLLQAFSEVDGGGSMIAVTDFTLPLGSDLADPFTFTFATLAVGVDSPQIRSVRFIGGTDSFVTPIGTFSVPNSVYYDNLRVVVPAPSAAVILTLSGVFASRRCR